MDSVSCVIQKKLDNTTRFKYHCAMSKSARKWKHNLPTVNGHSIVLEAHKLTEALELMWSNEIEAEEVDMYLVADWN